MVLRISGTPLFQHVMRVFLSLAFSFRTGRTFGFGFKMQLDVCTVKFPGKTKNIIITFRAVIMFFDAGTVGRSFVPTVRRTLCLCQMSSCMIQFVSAAAASRCCTMRRHYSSASRLLERAVPMAFW